MKPDPSTPMIAALLAQRDQRAASTSDADLTWPGCAPPMVTDTPPPAISGDSE